MDNAENRLRETKLRIEAACRRASRDSSEVTLIGASKTVSAIRVLEYAHAGLTDAGENYVQEGLAKQREYASYAANAESAKAEVEPHLETLRWHLIGALQSNKARQVIGAFCLVHSVDRLSLAQALSKAAHEAGIVQNVLLQVNIGDEGSKAGCASKDVVELARSCAALPHLQVCGLMCLPPFDSNAENSRPYFRSLRDLSHGVREAYSSPRIDARRVDEKISDAWHLSMGMTNDFEVAIEEGATLVRIGTGLFGAR